MRHASTSGYAMAALLVGLSVVSIMRGAALPVWQTAVTREGEAELIFCGERSAQAISLCQRRSAGTFPPSIDVLVKPRAPAHDSGPVCVAIASPYDSFIHCTSPV